MATAPTKAATPATVTLKHIAANLAEKHEMSKKDAESVLGDMIGLVVKHLKKGDRIRIGGLGILQVRKRAAQGLGGSDVSLPDHLGPLFGFVGDELSEVGGRACKRRGTQVSETCLHLGLRKDRIYHGIELLNDFYRRILGCT